MISIIIPLYNKEKIIERTLRSVLSQDYDDYEVVIVDDGSTDGSVEIVNNLLNQLNLRDKVQLLSQPNGGPSKARNTGVKAAKGEWIVFLDADDELLPGALVRFAEAIDVHKGMNFIACSFYNYDGKEKKLVFPYQEGMLKNPYKSDFYDEFLPRTGAFVCKKELLLKHPFNEQIRRFEDLDMLYRLYADAKIYLLSESSMVCNVEFAAASRGREDISEDFLGHLDFKGKSFWERMCLYELYLSERPHYPGQVDRLYPTLKWRYDLLLLTKILNLFK